MSTNALAPIADRVKAIIRMFSSDVPSDVLAAHAALVRLLRAHNCDIHMIADAIGTTTANDKIFSEAEVKKFYQVEAKKFYQRGFEDGLHEAELLQGTAPIHVIRDSWESMVAVCIDQLRWFDDKERRFLESLQNWDGTPTEKQLRWLAGLYTRVQR
jgi:hypothetical protein